MDSQFDAGTRAAGALRSTAEPPTAATPADGVAGEDRLGGGSWDWRRSFYIVWTLVGVAALLYMAGTTLRLLTAALLIFVVSALLAFVMHPLVTFVEAHLRLSRPLAASAVFVVLAFVLVAASVGAGIILVNELTAAIEQLPAYYQSLQERIPELEAMLGSFGIEINIRALQNQALAGLPSSGVAAQGLAWLAAFTDGLVNASVVLFLAFYLIVDGRRLAELALRVAPRRWKPYVLFVQKTLLKVVGGYLRGQLVMASTVSLSVFLISVILGIQFSLVLGLLAFIFEMIPMIGPMLIGTAMVGVALLDSVQLALLTLVVYFSVQFIESNFLGPRITGQAVGLHPIAAALGLISGAHLFGLWGAILAIPVLGFAFVTIAAVYQQVTGQSPEAVVVPRQPIAAWPPGWTHPPRQMWRRLRSATGIGAGAGARAKHRHVPLASTFHPDPADPPPQLVPHVPHVPHVPQPAAEAPKSP